MQLPENIYCEPHLEDRQLPLLPSWVVMRTGLILRWVRKRIISSLKIKKILRGNNVGREKSWQIRVVRNFWNKISISLPTFAHAWFRTFRKARKNGNEYFSSCASRSQRCPPHCIRTSSSLQCLLPQLNQTFKSSCLHFRAEISRNIFCMDSLIKKIFLHLYTRFKILSFPSKATLSFIFFNFSGR